MRTTRRNGKRSKLVSGVEIVIILALILACARAALFAFDNDPTFQLSQTYHDGR